MVMQKCLVAMVGRHSSRSSDSAIFGPAVVKGLRVFRTDFTSRFHARRLAEEHLDRMSTTVSAARGDRPPATNRGAPQARARPPRASGMIRRNHTQIAIARDPRPPTANGQAFTLRRGAAEFRRTCRGPAPAHKRSLGLIAPDFHGARAPVRRFGILRRSISPPRVTMGNCLGQRIR